MTTTNERNKAWCALRWPNEPRGSGRWVAGREAPGLTHTIRILQRRIEGEGRMVCIQRGDRMPLTRVYNFSLGLSVCAVRVARPSIHQPRHVVFLAKRERVCPTRKTWCGMESVAQAGARPVYTYVCSPCSARPYAMTEQIHSLGRPLGSRMARTRQRMSDLDLSQDRERFAMPPTSCPGACR